MNPDGTNVEILAHNLRNSYENCVTSFGDIFFATASSHAWRAVPLSSSVSFRQRYIGYNSGCCIGFIADPLRWPIYVGV